MKKHEGSAHFVVQISVQRLSQFSLIFTVSPKVIFPTLQYSMKLMTRLITSSSYIPASIRRSPTSFPALAPPILNAIRYLSPPAIARTFPAIRKSVPNVRPSTRGFLSSRNPIRRSINRSCILSMTELSFSRESSSSSISPGTSLTSQYGSPRPMHFVSTAFQSLGSFSSPLHPPAIEGGIIEAMMAPMFSNPQQSMLSYILM
ncbi:MAG: hypothetical protein MASP_01644 [Candidatus Methanolliviera sp. GoM_asphalt]|nr:MAG: hypothetical protein MASP_01644 [Candidatus Methanolliviera sp. GoM_asphalt]